MNKLNIGLIVALAITTGAFFLYRLELITLGEQVMATILALILQVQIQSER